MGYSRRFLSSVAAISGTALVLSGCAARLKAAAAEAPKTAVPAAIDASLTSFEDAQTRQRLVGVLESSEIQQVVRDLAQTALQGVLDNPAFDRAALRHRLREEVGEATRASLDTAANEVPRSLAPAVRTALVDTLGDPNVREAVSTTASEATRAALGASFDLVRELRESQPSAGPVRRLQRWLGAAAVAAFALGAVAAVLIMWAVNLRRRAQRTRDVARSVLTRAAEASRGRPWSEEMVRLLAQQLDEDRARDLRDLVGR